MISPHFTECPIATLGLPVVPSATQARRQTQLAGQQRGASQLAYFVATRTRPAPAGDAGAPSSLLAPPIGQACRRAFSRWLAFMRTTAGLWGLMSQQQVHMSSMSEALDERLWVSQILTKQLVREEDRSASLLTELSQVGPLMRTCLGGAGIIGNSSDVRWYVVYLIKFLLLWSMRTWVW
jgi:hypothetical protein